MSTFKSVFFFCLHKNSLLGVVSISSGSEVTEGSDMVVSSGSEPDRERFKDTNPQKQVQKVSDKNKTFDTLLHNHVMVFTLLHYS